jgi:hypothetical protein
MAAYYSRCELPSEEESLDSPLPQGTTDFQPDNTSISSRLPKCLSSTSPRTRKLASAGVWAMSAWSMLSGDETLEVLVSELR